MESHFIYDKHVTSKNFIGRKTESNILSNLLGQGENVLIYGPLKSGKTSLIRQTMVNMKVSAKQFIISELSVLNIRSISNFLKKYGSVVISSIASTPSEYQEIIDKYLSGTHFSFDQDMYSEYDEIVSVKDKIDENDARQMLLLPYKVAQSKKMPLYFIINEFQNIDYTEYPDWLYKEIESILKQYKNPDESAGRNICQFIFCGSRVNAMKEIFEIKKFFYKMVTHCPLQEIDNKAITEYIVKGLLSGGKVVDKELLHGVCKLFRGNMWYINHFMAICDRLSKGFVTDAILMEALDMLLAIHEPRFVSEVNGLTTHQLSLLRAIKDDYKKFNSVETINKYSLNSSANVKRVKDALLKKEIISFNDKEEAVILDPLFEYWLSKYFFEKRVEL